jgi:hypothetical protein
LLEGDVADLIDDEQAVAAQPCELLAQAAGGVGGLEPSDPLGRGCEQDAVASLGGLDAQADRELLTNNYFADLANGPYAVTAVVPDLPVMPLTIERGSSAKQDR